MKLTPQGLAVIMNLRHRGRFFARRTPTGYVIQGWPRRRSDHSSKSSKWYRDQFAIVGHMTANPHPLDLANAIEFAKGTIMVPRDFLTMAAYGKLYEIELPDGTIMPVADHGPPPETNPQVDDMAWEWTMRYNARTASYNTAAQCFKGNRWSTPVILSITQVRAVANFLSAGSYSVVIATIDGAGVIQTLVESSTQTPPSDGNQVLQFDVGMDVPSGSTFVVMVGRKDAGDTYAFPAYYVNSNQWLHYAPWLGSAVLAKANPAIGDTVTISGAWPSPMGLLLPST